MNSTNKNFDVFTRYEKEKKKFLVFFFFYFMNNIDIIQLKIQAVKIQKKSLRSN